MKRLFLLLPSLVIALPFAPQLSSGNAAVEILEKEICVVAQDRAMIRWQSFSVDSDETARFLLPSKNSLVVNQVIGSDPSSILGQLHANGKVVLINPNGVLFGKNASIHVEGLVASTFELNQKIFSEKGKLVFENQGGGEIRNLGFIQANIELQFISQEIEIEGQIFSPEISICAQSRAKVLGQLNAPGGRISLESEKIDLFGYLDVSHEVQAGTILINRSKIIDIHEGSELHADGIGWGNGGKILLLGNELARMAGSLFANGGQSGGDGGLLELSTHNQLDFTGKVSTLAPFGMIGNFIIDPLDLTIAANGGVNVSVTGNPFTPTAPGAILDNGNLSTALGLTNVTVTTLGTVGAAPGNITVNAPVAWVAGTTLTISSINDILVNNMVQHSTAAAGGVVLNAARDVTVSSAAIRTAIGSQNATTSITAGGNVSVIGSAGNRTAQIGFFTNGNGSANGPIDVNCANLTVQGGTGAFSGAMIGHGSIHANASFTINTAATATIGINASGNILLRNSSPAGSNAYGIIGHGAPGILSGSTLQGNIAITCGGNLDVNATFGGAVSPLSIGHSSPIPSSDNIGGSFVGDITIQVANQINLLGSNSVGGASVLIGHGGQFSGCDAASITGNLRICCGGNATLIAGTNGAVRVTNFTFTSMPMVPTITGDLDFAVGGNLIMQVNQSPGTSGSCFIGFANTAASAANVNMNMNVSVCGSAALSTANTSGNAIGIGIRTPNFTSGTNVNIAVQGNFTANNIDCTLFIGNQAGNLNFGLGGALDASMVGISTGAFSGGASGATRVYAGGSIIATPNVAGGTTSLTIGRQTGFQSNSVDVRAGGDIAWPNTMAAGLGGLSIQAGHPFAAGEIWNGNSTQLTSITGQATSFNLSCGACAAFSGASSPITPTCGAFAVSALTPATVSFTTTGPLTLTSLCTACSGSSSTLVVGAGGDISFSGTVGPINIGAFETINIQQNVTSSSSILISSCGDLTLQSGFGITSTGAGSPITLIADVENSGVGNLNLFGNNIQSNNGPICLMAGPGTFGCDPQNCLNQLSGLIPGGLSSVNQTSGAVLSGSGTTTVVASGDIFVSGSATSIGTTTGNISITAGSDLTIEENISSTGGAITTFSAENTLINSAALSASGEVRMIAGNDLSMVGNASITSLGGPVTIVVDHQAPSPPLIGTGSFGMSCSSQISSGSGSQVRIFTALRNLNNICLSAQIDGFAVGDPAFGFGTGNLYEDTPYELWCAYFTCPFPYPYPGHGFPFTVLYKDCLQQVLVQAMVVVDQFLVTLHPYNEFPGWKVEYWLKFDPLVSDMLDEPYMIRRRHLNSINHTKSWTLLLPE